MRFREDFSSPSNPRIVQSDRRDRCMNTWEAVVVLFSIQFICHAYLHLLEGVQNVDLGNGYPEIG